MTSTLLLGVTLTLLVSCHALKCYNCDTKNDTSCRKEPLVNRICEAKIVCFMIEYHVPGEDG